MQLSTADLLNKSLGENKAKLRRWNSWSRIAFSLGVLSILSNGSVWGQQSTAGYRTIDGRSRSSARSILDSTEPNGRIGGFQYRGALKPTPGENSRFSSGGVYGDAGNIVGVDNNSPNSAFQSSSRRFQTKKNFDLIAFRNELYRARAAQGAANDANVVDPNAPRVVSATAPTSFPKTAKRRVPYGKTPEEIAAETQAANVGNLANSEHNVMVPESAGAQNGAAPQRIWMRGLAPQGSGAQVPGSGDFNAGRNDDYSVGSRWIELDSGVRSEFSGATFDPNIAAATPLPALAPSPMETQAAFQEYLEAQLLRSPDVNALSPILVNFRDGIATIQGIVPTPSARETAGRILLADPRVQRVDNRLTFVRNDSENVPTAPIPVGGSVGSQGTTPPAAAPLPGDNVPQPTTLPDLAPLK